jgi:hypothetical protein
VARLEPDPVIEAYKKDVDRTLLRENLNRSVEERYARRLPFLHFHLVEGGRRRADVRGRTGWHSIELPRPLTVTKRRELLRELRTRYRERTGGRAR